MLECVSNLCIHKNYDDNFNKYERQLKVPYYLLSQPDVRELSLFRHNGRRYVSVKPNEQERLALPELELEVALLDEWVRFWFRGELLPLPADLQRDLDEARRQLDAAQQARLAAEQESARLRAEVEELKRRRNDKT